MAFFELFDVLHEVAQPTADKFEQGYRQTTQECWPCLRFGRHGTLGPRSTPLSHKEIAGFRAVDRGGS